jgi:hypothetical protein
MALETNTLINGQWTTRVLDVNTVLRHYDQQDKEAAANNVLIERAPTIGLLTQTVIRSPLVHWILPVRLRDIDRQDVAFIGVRHLDPISISILLSAIPSFCFITSMFPPYSHSYMRCYTEVAAGSTNYLLL